MSLYHKHRPATFEEMRGNESAIQAAQKLLEQEDHPHSFMIYGPSGCGKTTIARIIAKHLGATEISTHEINSSDNRGIDSARDIAERMRYRSADGAPTVFILDEVHRATVDFQNAMLKSLEDTPGHVYFFLCTTEPEKLITAIHTRCTKLELKPLPEDEMQKLLKRTAKKEGWTIPAEVFDKIVDNSDGSCRQALVFLEQVGMLDDEEKMLEVVENAVEVSTEVIELCRGLLANSSWKALGTILLKLKGQESEKIRRAVLGYMSAVVMKSGKMEAGICLQAFAESTYNTGYPGIVLATFTAHNELQG